MQVALLGQVVAYNVKGLLPEGALTINPIRGNSEAVAPEGELVDSPVNRAIDEIGAFKNFQVLGNGRLGCPEPGGCVAHAARSSTKALNDRATYRMREGLKPLV